VVDMPFIVALAAAALVGFLLWKLLVGQPAERKGGAAPTRQTIAPDDDPEFLRELTERLRREGEDPPSRR
jgi:hypothetical protein